MSADQSMIIRSGTMVVLTSMLLCYRGQWWMIQHLLRGKGVSVWIWFDVHPNIMLKYFADETVLYLSYLMIHILWKTTMEIWDGPTVSLQFTVCSWQLHSLTVKMLCVGSCCGKMQYCLCVKSCTCSSDCCLVNGWQELLEGRFSSRWWWLVIVMYFSCVCCLDTISVGEELMLWTHCLFMYSCLRVRDIPSLFVHNVAMYVFEVSV